MQIILLKRILGVGQIGDEVKVRPGYARNFLLPRGQALRATPDNREIFAQRKTQLEAHNLTEQKEATAVSKKLDNLVVVIIRQASESGRLYGSVTTRDIIDALKEESITIDRGQIQLEDKIKSTGMHPCRIILHPEVVSSITLNIARTDDEAEKQRRVKIITPESGSSPDPSNSGQSDDQSDSGQTITPESGSSPDPSNSGQSEDPSDLTPNATDPVEA